MSGLQLIPGLGTCEAEVGACNMANGSLPNSSLFDYRSMAESSKCVRKE